MDSAQPLLCTCSPSSSYFQNCKSQSVPEGLSTMSQQCKCKPQPSREYIYVPRQTPQQLQQTHNCSCHNLRQMVAATSGASAAVAAHANPNANDAFKNTAPLSSSTMPKCKLKRSQSLSRPMTYVEQMTTSV